MTAGRYDDLLAVADHLVGREWPEIGRGHAQRVIADLAAALRESEEANARLRYFADAVRRCMPTLHDHAREVETLRTRAERAEELLREVADGVVLADFPARYELSPAGADALHAIRAFLAEATPQAEECGQRIRGLFGAETRCVRPKGHPLPHTVNDGIDWSTTPQPEDPS